MTCACQEAPEWLCKKGAPASAVNRHRGWRGAVCAPLSTRLPVSYCFRPRIWFAQIRGQLLHGVRRQQQDEYQREERDQKQTRHGRYPPLPLRESCAVPTLGGQPCKNCIAGTCPARNDKGTPVKTTGRANSLSGTVRRHRGESPGLPGTFPARVRATDPYPEQRQHGGEYGHHARQRRAWQGAGGCHQRPRRSGRLNLVWPIWGTYLGSREFSTLRRRYL